MAKLITLNCTGPGSSPDLDSRNFVLCPGKEYDRSPCGTGPAPSWPACMRIGFFVPGQVWRQESVIGSIFEGRIAVRDGKLLPSITGSAFITAESTLILDPHDAFCWGIAAR